MFKFGKNKKITGQGVVDKAKQTKDIIAAETALYGKDLVAHVMPERFRSAKLSTRQAKKNGILVLLVGVIFLISALTLLYYYVLKPRLTAVPETNMIAQTAQPEERAQPGVRPSEKNNAVEPAVEGSGGYPDQPAPLPLDEPDLAAGHDTESENPSEADAGAFATATPIVATTSSDLAATSGETATSTGESSETPPAVTDLDRDGLSDSEERLLGSNTALADSDGDGFDDLTELINLYNPAGDGKITEAGAFAVYTNATYKYSILYSLGWPIQKFGGDDSVMFDIDGSQFFQVIVQPNVDNQSIEDWYKNQFGEERYSPARALSGKGWQGIANADGLVFYLTDTNREYLITLSYNLGAFTAETYKNIFELMVKTFTIND